MKKLLLAVIITLVATSCEVTKESQKKHTNIDSTSIKEVDNVGVSKLSAVNYNENSFEREWMYNFPSVFNPFDNQLRIAYDTTINHYSTIYVKEKGNSIDYSKFNKYDSNYYKSLEEIRYLLEQKLKENIVEKEVAKVPKIMFAVIILLLISIALNYYLINNNLKRR